MHKEVKIGQGVYVTDFRKEGELKGLSQPQQPQIKDLNLILDKITNNQAKINQLFYSNQAMQEEQNWENDPDFLQAIQQNFTIMLKFSQQMKELIVQIFALNYKPENEKMETLMNAQRIQQRQKNIVDKMNQFFAITGKDYGKKDEDKQENEDQQIPVEVDEGVYL